ncbi:hypothetical protein [Chitinivibrio alkaliphilus]|uniref:hypothetical protein n=1 Tax=Chitinivibrio alkaliphilus TaxID=1505232 RepID=UPI00041D1F8A|nr:hypothetical protein [Chitinivibrio alkaliphilus]
MKTYIWYIFFFVVLFGCSSDSDPTGPQGDDSARSDLLDSDWYTVSIVEEYGTLSDTIHIEDTTEILQISESKVVVHVLEGGEYRSESIALDSISEDALYGEALFTLPEGAGDVTEFSFRGDKLILHQVAHTDDGELSRTVHLLPYDGPVPPDNWIDDDHGHEDSFSFVGNWLPRKEIQHGDTMHIDEPRIGLEFSQEWVRIHQLHTDDPEWETFSISTVSATQIRGDSLALSYARQGDHLTLGLDQVGDIPLPDTLVLELYEGDFPFGDDDHGDDDHGDDDHGDDDHGDDDHGDDDHGDDDHGDDDHGDTPRSQLFSYEWHLSHEYDLLIVDEDTVEENERVIEDPRTGPAFTIEEAYVDSVSTTHIYGPGWSIDSTFSEEFFSIELLLETRYTIENEELSITRTMTNKVYMNETLFEKERVHTVETYVRGDLRTRTAATQPFRPRE